MTATEDERSARNRAAVLAYLDALNSHDADRIAACVADDFHNEHTSQLGTSVRGRTEYRARLDDFFRRFDDVRYEIEDLIVEDDRVALAYVLSCKATGHDGARHPVRIRGIFRFRVEDGVVAHRIDYWDGMEFERQLSST